MGRITSRIARSLAAAAVVVIPASLVVGAAPAYAAAHFSVDNDSIVLGASSTNSFKAFDGNVESWLDGTSIRATLTGPFVGRGTLRVKWIFSDNSTSTSSDYTAGVQHDVYLGSPLGKNVVRFVVSYTPNTGTYDEVTRYVGDSPQSLGTCEQLDADNLGAVAPGYASFDGHVKYGCNSAGNVTATVDGRLQWAGANGTSDRAIVSFNYSDGTSDYVLSSVVSSNGPTCDMVITSFPSKDVTMVTVRIQRDGDGDTKDVGPSSTVRFGDA